MCPAELHLPNFWNDQSIIEQGSSWRDKSTLEAEQSVLSAIRHTVLIS